VIVLTLTALVAPLAGWTAGRALGSTPQTIAFAPLPDRLLDQPALLVTATASSGLPVTFATTTPSVCSATGTNGATISPKIAGVCTVQADQAGNATYAAAPSVQQSFEASKDTQTITFAPLPDRAINLGALTVTATASTGFAVVFSTTTPAVCTSSGTNGATITPVAIGTCTVQADQPGNTIFEAAPSVQQSFDVVKAGQAITFNTLAAKTTLQSPVTVSAIASSLLTVTFTTTTPAVCNSTGANGATIVLVTSGTCTVQADQAGNATYNAATPVQRSFVVTRAAQTITFAALANRTTAQSPVTVAASASSGLTVTFSTTTTGVCTSGGTNGATITLVAPGTCTVEADQAGNATYSPAATVAQSFTVTRSAQTITFGALADRDVLQPPFVVAATASSGLDVSFSTTTPLACTSSGIQGATITLVGVGTCTVEADQAGNALFNAAPAVQQSFAVVKVDQSIVFGALPNIPLGPPFDVMATATSGLTVTFSSITPAVCTASGTAGSTITLVATGTCSVRADQSGDATYNAAPSVLQSFGVGKTDQVITFTGPGPVAVNHPPLPVAATATSGLPVTFSTTTPAVCAAGGAGGATITLLGAGTCTVQADQAGDGTFNPAPPVTRSFAVTKVNQTITFPSLPSATLTPTHLMMHATASSHLAVTFATTSPSVCRTTGTNGASIILVAVGTCVVQADQIGNAIFDPAPTVTRQFAVKPAVPPTRASGYWMLGADGHVFAFGGARDFGSSGSPAVAIAARRDGRGYWVTDDAGDVRAFGQATFHGGRPALRPGELVSTMSRTPSGDGYWLFTTFGRAFAYGDAHFYGDMSGVALNGPVIASVATPTGHGYYMVGSDGGVFTFGDARFHGSMGAAHLNQPIVGLSPSPDNRGYWLVAADGGVFAFDAPFRGSLGAIVLVKPVNGLVAYGNGYLMVASDGGVFDFSDKAFVGSLGGAPPAAPIIGIAALST